MKHGLLAFCFVALIGGILFATKKDESDELIVLSERNTMSQLLTSVDETIVFAISFSKEKTLFVESDYLVDAFISNDEMTLPLNIKKILRQGDSFDREGIRYFPYLLAFELGFQADLGFTAEIREGVLSLRYLEGLELDLPIGDYAVRVDSIKEDSPLSLVRLYGRKSADSCRGIDQLLVGIENVTAIPIEIESITSGYGSMNWQSIRVSNWHPKTGSDDLMQYGEAIGERIPSLPGNGTQYLVWRRNDEQDRFAQFYINIHYRFLGQSQTFIIDDFRFYQDIDEGECHEQRFAKTRYVYPR